MQLNCFRAETFDMYLFLIRDDQHFKFLLIIIFGEEISTHAENFLKPAQILIKLHMKSYILCLKLYLLIIK